MIFIGFPLHSPHGSTLHVISVSIAGSSLKTGETLFLIYGDKRGGSPGVKAQPLAREVAFPVFLTYQARGKTFLRQGYSTQYVTVRDVCDAATFVPRLKVVGGKADKFLLKVPSIIEKEWVDVKAVAVDKHSNRSEKYSRSAIIFLSDFSATEKIRFSDRGRGKRSLFLTSKRNKATKIVAVDLEKQVVGVSNPFIVDKAGTKKKLFWGEIHAHSILSDALPKIEEHYEYARDVASLDFAAVSDHDRDLYAQSGSWDILKEAAEKYNNPGKFVTLLGYELLLQCNSGRTPHVNIYFPGTKGELISHPNVEELEELAKKYGAILIPHHTQYGYPGMGTDWNELKKGFSSKEMRLVEIWSTHGNSEYFGCPFSVKWPKKGRSVQDGLVKGIRLGIIAGSDYHETLLGHGMYIPDYPRTINNAHMQVQTGLTAVFAQTLSREEIFTALSRREVYGTTGARILIDFYVNGIHMGGEIKGYAEERHIRGLVEGTAKLKKVEIISKEKTVHTARITGESSVIDWKDTAEISPGSYYYLRVTQEDGHMA